MGSAYMWTRVTREGVRTWRTRLDGRYRAHPIMYEGVVETRVDDDGATVYIPEVVVAQAGRLSAHTLSEAKDLEAAQRLVETKIDGMTAGGFHH